VVVEVPNRDWARGGFRYGRYEASLKNYAHPLKRKEHADARLQVPRFILQEMKQAKR
jgi:hypothetical protein